MLNLTKSALPQSPLKSSLEEQIKPLMMPDMYALQHMKALQETNPALKALVDARGMS